MSDLMIADVLRARHAEYERSLAGFQLERRLLASRPSLRARLAARLHALADRLDHHPTHPTPTGC